MKIKRGFQLALILALSGLVLLSSSSPVSAWNPFKSKNKTTPTSRTVSSGPTDVTLYSEVGQNGYSVKIFGSSTVLRNINYTNNTPTDRLVKVYNVENNTDNASSISFSGSGCIKLYDKENGSDDPYKIDDVITMTSNDSNKFTSSNFSVMNDKIELVKIFTDISCSTLLPPPPPPPPGGTAQAKIFAYPNPLSLSFASDENPKKKTITITNDVQNNTTLGISGTTNLGDLISNTLFQNGKMTSKNQSDPISLEITFLDNLSAGTHSGVLNIFSDPDNASNSPYAVPITITITGGGGGNNPPPNLGDLNIDIFDAKIGSTNKDAKDQDQTFDNIEPNSQLKLMWRVQFASAHQATCRLYQLAPDAPLPDFYNLPSGVTKSSSCDTYSTDPPLLIQTNQSYDYLIDVKGANGVADTSGRVRVRVGEDECYIKLRIYSYLKDSTITTYASSNNKYTDSQYTIHDYYYIDEGSDNPVLDETYKIVLILESDKNDNYLVYLVNKKSKINIVISYAGLIKPVCGVKNDVLSPNIDAVEIN